MNTQNFLNTPKTQSTVANASGLSAVYFWQFGYGFYYRQEPSRL